MGSSATSGKLIIEPTEEMLKQLNGDKAETMTDTYSGVRRQSKNYSQSCVSYVKHTFAEFSSFESVMVLLELWKIFIHSFSFPLTGGKHCRVCVEQSKDLPRLNVTPIMDLYSQNKFEKLISIFKVQYNPKENVDARELAYISSLFHAVFFSELPFFLM